MALAQPDLQDIKSYFQRPRVIARGALPTTFSRVPTFRYSITKSNLATYFPQWDQRLSGAYGVTFDIRFRLQLATTAFHQGLVVMGFQYGTEANGTTTNEYDRGSHIATLTNLPHVRLDISENTMCELVIPYHNPEPFLAVDFADIYGNVTFYPIHPLRFPAGGVAPDFELLISLENVKVYGARPLGSTAIVLQSGVLSKEATSSTSGIISKPLSTLAKASTVLAGIPSLSSIAGPTAWMLKSASKVAAAFGYSKPTVQSTRTLVVRQDDACENNVDLPAAVTVVGQFASNSQVVGPALGASDVDEMALSYILQQYSQISRASANMGNLQQTVVYSTLVCPLFFWYRDFQFAATTSNILPPYSSVISTTNGNSFIPSSLMSVCQMFKLWRGGITFRFTCAKTKMHGGRYLINYYPEITRFGSIANPLVVPINAKGAEVNNGSVQPSGYSTIWDLKDSSVLEFTVPHVVEEPWLHPTNSVGSLTLTVMDRLMATSAISDTLDFIIEVKGASDFEVAGFTGSQFVQYPTGGTIYTQSGDIVTTHADPKPYTIGEDVTSVKQLIMTPCTVTATVANNTVGRQWITPWFWQPLANSIVRGLASPLPLATTFVGSGNHLAHIAAWYIYAKGGTDLHIYPNSSAGNQRMVVEAPAAFVCSGNTGSTTVTTTYNNNFNAAATPKVIATMDRPLHLRLPAMFKSLRAYTKWFAGFNALTYWGALPTTLGSMFSALNDPHMPLAGLYKFISNNTSGATQTYTVRIAAADDAQLAHYIGPVPYVIPNNAGTNSLYPDYTV